MGTEAVVLLSPDFNQDFGLSQGSEPLGVQALVPEFTVKAFTLPILSRTAGPINNDLVP